MSRCYRPRAKNMRICIRLFGPAAQAAGAQSVVVEADEPLTCVRLVDAISRQYPILQRHVEFGRLAVNATYGLAATPVRESDEVALISMVSGG